MAAGEQKQPPARERSRLFSAGAAYALFGFATAAVSFVFLVDPALRPDPRENQIASISTAAVDRGITLRGYAERVGEQNSAQLRKYGLAACIPGNVVYLRQSLLGFKNRQTTLNYLIMDEATHTRLYLPPGQSGSGVAASLTGEVTSDQGVSLYWIQWPYHYGTYFIRFELVAGKQLLAIADTDPFTVTISRYTTIVDQCKLDIHNHHASEGQLNVSEASLAPAGGTDTGQVLLDVFLALLFVLVGVVLYDGIVWFRDRNLPD
jgi:hypothetical protein